MQDRFAPAVANWQQVLGRVRDVVRQELVADQLAAHLPDRSSGTAARRTAASGTAASVLDVGCGQGTQAIRLARRGFHVTGVDLSAELLDVARAAAAAEPDAVQQRLTWRRGDLLHDPAGGHRYDVVCCHGVLMYLPSLDQG
ncbi:MAG TPA: methyltransferase domain-containing protein, partial [Acidimicrobiales bacterium]|nr:methyltransferase domain-containing protein [Acidimicrobiales bacterium]